MIRRQETKQAPREVLGHPRQHFQNLYLTRLNTSGIVAYSDSGGMQGDMTEWVGLDAVQWTRESSCPSSYLNALLVG